MRPPAGRSATVERAGRGARALAVLVAMVPLVMDPGGWFPYVALRWAVLGSVYPVATGMAMLAIVLWTFVT